MTLGTRQKHYLQAMGIPTWSARRELPGAAKKVDISIPEVVTKDEVAFTSIIERDTNEWQRLKQQVSLCQACDLASSRTNVVFGVGNDSAKLMIIGEAPGQDEDRQGEPFVGRAGQLLNQMLLAIGIARESVFIANILKCRPPNNRDPRPEEVVKCADFLLRQIQYIKPKIILSVGRISAQNLLQKDEAIGRLRGQIYQHPLLHIPIIVTYHPAYLLRSPQEKQKVWKDLLLIKQTLAEKQ